MIILIKLDVFYINMKFKKLPSLNKKYRFQNETFNFIEQFKIKKFFKKEIKLGNFL
jgi:hypothetical protein